MPRRKRVTGNLERRGNSFRIRLCVDGKRHKFTIATTDRRVAEAYAAKCEEELQDQAARRLAGLVTGMQVSALFDKFEREEMPRLADGTQGAYSDSLKPIRRYFIDEMGDPTVESVRRADILGFLAWRRVNRLKGTEPLTNRTLQKDRTVLHRLFAYADDLEWRDGNPVARTDAPKPDKRDPVILTSTQYDKLLDACKDRLMLYLYVLLLGETGERCESEALWLTWEDVELEEGFIRVVTGRNGHRTKAGRGRWVPMTPRLAAAIREHFRRYRFAGYNGKPTPWLFHHDRTALRYTAGARIGSLYDGFRRAARRAKLPDRLTQHDLRHRRVTVWLAEGKSPVLVKEAMGHSDIRTTMGYTHLAKEHLRALVDTTPGRKKEDAAS